MTIQEFVAVILEIADGKEGSFDDEAFIAEVATDVLCALRDEDDGFPSEGAFTVTFGKDEA